MTAHAESVLFNRARYSDLLVRIGLIGNLNRRESMLVWLTLLCFDIPDLSPLPDHSPEAMRGLQHLMDKLDYEFVTYGNPALLRDLVERIKIARYQGPLPSLPTSHKMEAS